MSEADWDVVLDYKCDSGRVYLNVTRTGDYMGRILGYPSGVVFYKPPYQPTIGPFKSIEEAKQAAIVYHESEVMPNES